MYKNSLNILQRGQVPILTSPHFCMHMFYIYEITPHDVISVNKTSTFLINQLIN